jgi:uncharacterized protein (TIGR02271 family)
MNPQAPSTPSNASETNAIGDAGGVCVPLLEERVDIDRRTVATADVRVRKATRETQQTIDVLLQREDVEVRRVAINRPVERAAQVRREGDVLIVPLHEEVPVVTTQLMLAEELHISLRRSEVVQPTQVALRREAVEIERTPASTPPNTGSGEADPPSAH